MGRAVPEGVDVDYPQNVSLGGLKSGEECRGTRSSTRCGPARRRTLYVALDSSNHGFRKTTSLEDSFRRWNSPGVERNPQITATRREWIEKVP